ncbi:hypothetical protein [Scytonema sp. NUACC26]|uniref:hypothetical protein n=1 Tax=Scytonema sp. NUACC26 TaxID=3140176 RepID=UPI0038B3CDFE
MNYRLKFAVLITSSLLLSVAVPSLLKTSETVILRAFAQTPTSENRKAFNARTSEALPGKNTNSTGIPLLVVNNCILTP